MIRKLTTVSFILLFFYTAVSAQFPGVGARFGVDGGLFSGILEFPVGTVSPTDDWFKGSGDGLGVIDESVAATISLLLQNNTNPVFEVRMSQPASSVIDGQIWIDAIYARDNFGGTGHTDPTSYTQASKNGQDPAAWATGPSNVLGKNDLIDVAGHMRRDGPTLEDGDLWFFGLAIIAEPGGSAYLDFEFFNEEISFTPGVGFSSGGPQLGHTAFQFDKTDPNNWKISKVGDFIFSTDVSSSGLDRVDMRIWVSRSDYNTIRSSSMSNLEFEFTSDFDGAYNGAPYGYAKIEPKSSNFGQVNTSLTDAPPWGHRGTKSNVYRTTIGSMALIEMGVNLTEFGIDHISVEGLDECAFPINTYLVKTRASQSFTAQLKDFAGPYGWGRPKTNAVIVGVTELSCQNPITTLSADPVREDASYLWSTTDGNIIGSVTSTTIEVDRPGTYRLEMFVLLDEVDGGCPADADEVVVGYDEDFPFFESVTAIPSVSCSGEDGSINLSFSGGTAPYSFLWSNSETSQNIVGLEPGTYSVTITDANTCTITTSATVSESVPKTITPTLTHVDCFGRRNGSISLEVEGNGPFTYQWSTGSVSKNISNLGAGSYTVIITDADGCSTERTYTITQPAAITRSISATNSTNNEIPGNGSIVLTVDGGTSPYEYDWTVERDGVVTSSFSTDKDLNNLFRGKYTVVITDQNGCTATISANIWEPEICDDGIDNSGNGLVDCQDPVCVPAPPDLIAADPDENPCIGEVITYSVTNDPALSGYVWTVPDGAAILSGQGTHSVDVEWITTEGGQVCVKADNFGCLSTAICITVKPDDVPARPNEIIIENKESI